MKVHKTVAKIIKAYFPNTLVLPAIGNNDPIFHYSDINVKATPEEKDFFPTLYKLYFEDFTVNSKLNNLKDIK